MIQNKLFRDCLAAIPAEQKAEFDLSFGIAERISEILKAKGLTQKDFDSNHCSYRNCSR